MACRGYARRQDEMVLPRTVSQVVTEFLAAKLFLVGWVLVRGPAEFMTKALIAPSSCA